MFFLLGHGSKNQFSAASAAGSTAKQKRVSHFFRRGSTNFSWPKPNKVFNFKNSQNCFLMFDSDVPQRNGETVNPSKDKSHKVPLDLDLITLMLFGREARLSF